MEATVDPSRSNENAEREAPWDQSSGGPPKKPRLEHTTAGGRPGNEAAVKEELRVPERSIGNMVMPCLTHYRKTRMEHDEVVKYLELLADGDRETMTAIAKLAAKHFRGLAALLVDKWNVRDAEISTLMRASLPPNKNVAFLPQGCNQNAALHNLVPLAAMRVVSDGDGWKEASAKLRECPFVSIAVAKAFNPGGPARLGAVAFHARPRDDEPPCYDYVIQPSAIDESLNATIFRELEDILGLPEKRIVLWKDDIFCFREFAYLKRGLKDRWMIEIQRMSPGKFLLQINELTNKVVTGKFCERGSVSTWTGPPQQIALHHLSIRCKLAMEYPIVVSPNRKTLVHDRTSALQTRLITEWPKAISRLRH